MVEPRRLSDLVDGVLRRLALPVGELAVAVSGGADSAALAFVLVGSGRAFRALHVDHGLPGSPLMEKAAIAISEHLDIDLEVVRVSVPEGASPEGQARRARYEAFAGALATGERLLTAHTRDDNVETILFNIIRGTGSRGLTGIPYHRPPGIFRPALAVSRSETREIAALAGLGFVDDPMNEDPGITRNLIRTRVIPTLRQLNPSIEEAMTRMASAVASDVRYLDSLAQRSHRDDDLVVGTLKALPRPVADRLIRMAFESAAGGSEVTADRLERVWRVIDEEASSQEIGGGVTVHRHGPRLVFSKAESPELAQEPVTLTAGTHHVGPLEFDVTRVSGVCHVVPLSKWAAVFPAETRLVCRQDGVVTADGEVAWVPGQTRLPVAWYEVGTIGYLSVFAREKT